MQTVDAAMNDLADAVLAVVDELVDEVMHKIYDQLPALDERLRLQLDAPMRRSASGLVHGALVALRTRRYEPVETPLEAVEEARAAARAGLRLADLLTMYRLGHQLSLDRCLRMATDICPDAGIRSEVLRIGSRFIFTYIDGVVADVVAAFERERDGYLRSNAQRNVQMVRDVLDGAVVDAGELGYDLLGPHVGVVAEGPKADGELAGLAQQLGVRSLIVPASGDVAWAWLSTAKPVTPPNSTVRFGVGDALSGPDGFRITHRQAVLACTVAVRSLGPYCRYDDVTVEAAALRDEIAARRFVERELGPLAVSGERNDRLRETIAAYLDSGHKAATAGVQLNITDRTVAYRLRSSEQILGRPIQQRSAELQIALRWGAVLGMFDKT